MLGNGGAGDARSRRLADSRAFGRRAGRFAQLRAGAGDRSVPVGVVRLQDEATELINRTAGVNRVIARVASREPLEHQRVFASSITHGRLDLLRRADAIVREICS